MSRTALRAREDVLRMKTPSQVAGIKTSFALTRADLAYCKTRARRMEGASEKYAPAVIEAIRDQRTLFDLPQDQFDVLRGAAGELSNRDYIRRVLSEAAFDLRETARASGASEPPAPPVVVSPLPVEMPREEEVRTSATIPHSELEYCEEERAKKDVGSVPKAIVACVRDHRTFFDLPQEQVAYLAQEAKRLSLDSREYMRRLLSERAFTLRLQARGSTTRQS